MLSCYEDLKGTCASMATEHHILFLLCTLTRSPMACSQFRIETGVIGVIKIWDICSASLAERNFDTMYCWYSYPILAAGIDFFFSGSFYFTKVVNLHNVIFYFSSILYVVFGWREIWGEIWWTSKRQREQMEMAGVPPLVMNNDHTAWFRYEFIGNKPLEKSMLPLSLHLPFLWPSRWSKIISF